MTTTIEPYDAVDLGLFLVSPKLAATATPAAPVKPFDPTKGPAPADYAPTSVIDASDAYYNRIDAKAQQVAEGWDKWRPTSPIGMAAPVGRWVQETARSWAPYAPPMWFHQPEYLETEALSQTKGQQPLSKNPGRDARALAFSSVIGNAGGDRLADTYGTKLLERMFRGATGPTNPIPRAVARTPQVLRPAARAATRFGSGLASAGRSAGLVGIAGEFLDYFGMAPGWTGGRGMGAEKGSEITKPLDLESGLVGRDIETRTALENRLKSFGVKDVPDLRRKFEESKASIAQAKQKAEQLRADGRTQEADAYERTSLDQREAALNYLGLLNDYEPFLYSASTGSVGSWGDSSKQQFHNALTANDGRSTMFQLGNLGGQMVGLPDISANTLSAQAQAAVENKFNDLRRRSDPRQPSELEQWAKQVGKAPNDPAFLMEVDYNLKQQQQWEEAYRATHKDVADNDLQADRWIGEQWQRPGIGQMSEEQAKFRQLATDPRISLDVRERIQEGLRRHHAATRAQMDRGMQSVLPGLSAGIAVPTTALYAASTKPINTINALADTAADVASPFRPGSVVHDLAGGRGLMGQLAPGSSLEENTIGRNIADAGRLANSTLFGMGNAENDPNLRTAVQVQQDNIKAKNVGHTQNDLLSQRFATGFYKEAPSAYPAADIKNVNTILKNGSPQTIEAAEKDLRKQLASLELAGTSGPEYAKVKDTWAALYGAMESKRNNDRLASGEINKQNFETPEGQLRGPSEVASQSLVYGLSDSQVIENMRRLKLNSAKAESTDPQLAQKLYRKAQELEQALQARRDYAKKYFDGGSIAADAPHPYANDPEAALSREELQNKLREYKVKLDPDNDPYKADVRGTTTPDGYRHRLWALWKRKWDEEYRAADQEDRIRMVKALAGTPIPDSGSTEDYLPGVFG